MGGDHNFVGPLFQENRCAHGIGVVAVGFGQCVDLDTVDPDDQGNAASKLELVQALCGGVESGACVGRAPFGIAL